MKKTSILILILILLLGSACHANHTATLTPSPTDLAESVATLVAATQAQQTPTHIATALPTPTPLPGRIILWTPAGSDPGLASPIEAKLAAVAQSQGLQFEKQAELSAGDLEQVKLVIALAPGTDLAALAKSAPQTQFLAVGIPGLEVSDNLSVLTAQDDPAGQQAFLGGATAAIVTADFRVAFIGQQDLPGEAAATQAFSNGVRFFCGLCRPVVTYRDAQGKFITFPLVYELPAAADEAAQVAAARYLADHYIRTVFVLPGAGSPALYQALAQDQIQILAGQAPAALDRNAYVATLDYDPIPALGEALPSLLAGQGGLNLTLPLAFSEINPANFSPGRQVEAGRILSDLNAGYIDIGLK